MNNVATRYLTTSELIYINGRVLNDEQILKGERKIRDIDLLEAAVMRPAASAFGRDAYPTLPRKVSALMHSIARNHPFADGNKRTATVSAIFMLTVNGHRVTWDDEDALGMIVNLAQGHRNLEEFERWLLIEPGGAVFDQNESLDVQIIDRIIEQHRWLLDELAER